MSQCEDIDVALANLRSATEAMKQRMNALEQKQRECCEQNLNKKQNNTDLEPIYTRLSKIEAYINSLDIDIKEISNILNSIHDNLKPLLNFIDDLASGILNAFNKIFDIFT